MQRDSAKESVADARESMNAATNAFQAKQREVEPLQTGRKNQNDLQRNVQAEFRDLEVRSEQELDAKVCKRHTAFFGISIVKDDVTKISAAAALPTRWCMACSLWSTHYWSCNYAIRP